MRAMQIKTHICSKICPEHEFNNAARISQRTDACLQPGSYILYARKWAWVSRGQEVFTESKEKVLFDSDSQKPNRLLCCVQGWQGSYQDRIVCSVLKVIGGATFPKTTPAYSEQAALYQTKVTDTD